MNPRIGNVYSLTKKNGLFFSVCVDDITVAGKKQNVEPTWKVLMKDVDLGEPRSFVDHVCLGCTQRECQISKKYCGELQKYVRIQDFCR